MDIKKKLSLDLKKKTIYIVSLEITTDSWKCSLRKAYVGKKSYKTKPHWRNHVRPQETKSILKKESFPLCCVFVCSWAADFHLSMFD